MLDILESCHGLRGCWVQHGLWAQVQTAAYQLLHEHRDGEFEQFFLLQNIEVTSDHFYSAQGSLR